MKFNLDKCYILHIGNYKPLTNYSMKDVQLKSVDNEKNVGVIITRDLKPSYQCIEVIKIANNLLVSLVEEVWMALCI